MSTNLSRQFAIALLIFGAVVFGMALAGGLNLTPTSLGSPEPSPQIPERSGVAMASFADLAEAVLPGVVSVGAVTIGSGSRPSEDPFEFFFGPRGRRGQPREYRSEGAGSGFVISPDGWIVTNNHVIDGATEVKVELGDREYSAEVKGADPSTDLALLKVELPRKVEYLALGDSDELRVGDWVMAIGNPYRLDHTVTVGVVSAKGRQIGLTDSSFENFIQTDAAINRGNSGGPLVNTAGEVVGISTAMNFGAENIGFAVPVNILRQILPQLQERGRVQRGYLGVNIRNLDHDSKAAFGLESTDGALVEDVRPKSPASAAGLRPGDVILRVDDAKVKETRDLIDYVAGKSPGTEVSVELFRDGETVSKSIKLGERDVEIASTGEGEEGGGETEWLGIQYQDLTAETRGLHRIPSNVEGIWITDIAPDSPLWEEQVRPGDIIIELNGQGVADVRQFEALLGEMSSGEYVRLYVVRFAGGNRLPFFAIVRVP